MKYLSHKRNKIQFRFSMIWKSLLLKIMTCLMDIWYRSFNIFMYTEDLKSYYKWQRQRQDIKCNVNLLNKELRWWDSMSKRDSTNSFIINCRKQYSHCTTCSSLIIRYVPTKLHGWTKSSTQRTKWPNSNKMFTRTKD